MSDETHIPESDKRMAGGDGESVSVDSLISEPEPQPDEPATADASGHGIVGTLTNGPTFAAGKYGNAVALDGVNDFVISATRPRCNSLAV